MKKSEAFDSSLKKTFNECCEGEVNIEFFECDTCRAKPGSPILCNGCLKNRQIVYEAGKYINQLLTKLKQCQKN
jgi:hypothetical protein